MTAIIIVDANVMVGAIMGTSLPLIATLATRAMIVTPPAQLAETRKILAKRGVPDIEQQLVRLLDIVEPLNPLLFADYEEAARQRLHARSQPDWPMLAAALALGGAIWSRDKDLQGTGVPVWFTRNIRFVGTDVLA